MIKNSIDKTIKKGYNEYCSIWNTFYGGIKLDIFSGINPEEKKEILSKSEIVTLNKGKDIYKKGYIGVLNSGCARIIRTGSGGGSVTIRTINAGDIFGAASIFGDWDEGFSSIISETGCSISYFAEETFKSIIGDFPDFSLNYIWFLTDRIRFLNRRLDTFSAKTTQNKLYEFLMSQADDNGVVVLDISMSELSKRLNMGRTSLYRDFSSLENANLIVKKGKKIYIK